MKRIKKRTGEEQYEEDLSEIDWAEYMVCAREMGMSEEEFFNSDPIFFNECYEIFKERETRKWQMN